MRVWLLILVACQAAPPVAPGRAPLGNITPEAGVDALDRDGWTELHHAAMGHDLAAIDKLLRRGANLEARVGRPYANGTPLVIALEFGNDDAAKLLLDRGASTAGEVGASALTLAARGGADAILDVLIARGVPVKATFALHAAARYGYATTIARLVKAGALVNEPMRSDHDFTPLIVACAENKLEAARTLIAAGANVNDRDSDGVTPLHWAVFGARPDEIHEYAELGGEHDTYYVPQDDAPLVQLLLDHGAELEAVDKGGTTPLHEAAMMDARAAAVLLVKAGANQATRDREGKTAFDLAHERTNSVESVLRP